MADALCLVGKPVCKGPPDQVHIPDVGHEAGIAEQPIRNLIDTCQQSFIYRDTEYVAVQADESIDAHVTIEPAKRIEFHAQAISFVVEDRGNVRHHPYG
jgi:hypothetical protein